MHNENVKFKIMLIGMFFFGIFGWAKSSWAARYYVATTGNDANSGSQAQPWLTVQKAANTIVAGDTCLVSAGSYNEYVSVAYSGASGNMITFEAAANVTIRGFSINGKNYIRINGFEITNQGFSDFQSTSQISLLVLSSIGTEIINNYIHDTTFCGIKLHDSGSSQRVIIRNNKISFPGKGSNGTGGGAAGIIATGDQILIENNDISHVTDYIALYGQYNVVRNNTFHDSYGATDFPSSADPFHIDGIESSQTSGGVPLKNALIERNTLYDSLVPNAHFMLLRDTQHAGASDVIIRFNSINHIGSYFTVHSDNFPNVRIYNNTVRDTESNIPKEYGDSGPTVNSPGGKLINNIYYNNVIDGGYVYAVDSSSLSGFSAHNNLVFNSGYTSSWGWKTSGNLYTDLIQNDLTTVKNRDPLFISPTDLNLPNGSPAIDSGGELKKVSASDSGIGTRLIVDDAGMFQDGQGGIVNTDWIAVGNAKNTCQIKSIDNTSNTITIDRAITRAAGDPVYLFEDSGGRQVLYGNTPDIGAYEYVQGADTTPPAAPTGLAVN